MVINLQKPGTATAEVVCLQAQGIEDLEAALRLQPTSAALVKDRTDAITALTAAEGLTLPASFVRVPVTSAADVPLLAEPHNAATAEPGNASLHPSSSRRIGVHSSVHGLDSGNARPGAAADAMSGQVDFHGVGGGAQAKSRSTSAGDNMPVEHLGSTTAPPSVPAPALPAKALLSLAQPGQLPAEVPGQSGTHASSPPAALVERPEQGMAPVRQPSITAGSPSAQPQVDSVLPDAMPAVTEAMQAARAAALRPAASGQEFERNWRSFKGAALLQQAYLQLLDPAAVPSIFKSSLTPALLGDAVLCILRSIAATSRRPDEVSDGGAALDANAWDLTHCIQLLNSFSASPRFSVVKLAIPGARRNELRAAWDASAAAVVAPAHADELARLRTLYGM